MYNILHLERSSLISKMVKTEFEGREIISNYYRAKDEAEAIEMLETYDIHLIICSMFTKEGSTEIFIKSINEGKYEEIPIFIVSSTESDEDKKKFINLGITDFLTKSEIGEIYKHILIMFKQDELMNCLREAKTAILDDSTLEREVLKKTLVKHGISNIDMFASGSELFENNKDYDLYLIDAVLKKEYAKNIVSQLRRNNHNASIVIISSIDNKKSVASLLDAGANDYIQKPIDEKFLIAKLKSDIRANLLTKKLSHYTNEL